MHTQGSRHLPTVRGPPTHPKVRGTRVTQAWAHCVGPRSYSFPPSRKIALERHTFEHANGKICDSSFHRHMQIWGVSLRKFSNGGNEEPSVHTHGSRHLPEVRGAPAHPKVRGTCV